MRIEYLLIRNFKSIRELEINDIEDVLILVGRNNASVLKMRIWLYCIRRDRSVLLSIMTCGIRIFAINFHR